MKITMKNSARETTSTPIHKAGEPFKAEAISLNLASGILFIPFAVLVMVVAQWWTVGWDTFAQYYLYAFIITLAFGLWFPYSKMVRRSVTFYPDEVVIGKREIHIDTIKHVVSERHGNTIILHLTNIKDPVQIRMENEYQRQTRDFLIGWCAEADISFEEKNRAEGTK